MRATQDRRVDREAAGRALIDLVAGIAWAERQYPREAQLQRLRDEAMALLSRIQQGDREAAQRAMELVDAAERGSALATARRRAPEAAERVRSTRARASP